MDSAKSTFEAIKENPKLVGIPAGFTLIFGVLTVVLIFARQYFDVKVTPLNISITNPGEILDPAKALGLLPSIVSYFASKITILIFISMLMMIAVYFLAKNTFKKFNDSTYLRVKSKFTGEEIPESSSSSALSTAISGATTVVDTIGDIVGALKTGLNEVGDVLGSVGGVVQNVGGAVGGVIGTVGGWF